MTYDCSLYVVLLNLENRKTLEESAREYQLTHGKKTELQEVEVFTGEENESNVIQVRFYQNIFGREKKNKLMLSNKN